MWAPSSDPGLFFSQRSNLPLDLARRFFGIRLVGLVSKALRLGTVAGSQHQLGIKLAFLQGFLYRSGR